MKTLLKLLLGVLLLQGCASNATMDEVLSIEQSTLLTDSLYFERPILSQSNYPGYLVLYKNGQYNYFSMPEWSCYSWIDVNGKWSITNDTLTLFDRGLAYRMSHDSTIPYQEFAKYIIHDSTLSLVRESGTDDYIGRIERVFRSKSLVSTHLSSRF